MPSPLRHLAVPGGAPHLLLEGAGEAGALARLLQARAHVVPVARPAHGHDEARLHQGARLRGQRRPAVSAETDISWAPNSWRATAPLDRASTAGCSPSPSPPVAQPWPPAHQPAAAALVRRELQERPIRECAPARVLHAAPQLVPEPGSLPRLRHGCAPARPPTPRPSRVRVVQGDRLALLAWARGHGSRARRRRARGGRRLPPLHRVVEGSRIGSAAPGTRRRGGAHAPRHLWHPGRAARTGTPGSRPRRRIAPAAGPRTRAGRRHRATRRTRGSWRSS
jgi:hypothetical protein